MMKHYEKNDENNENNEKMMKQYDKKIDKLLYYMKANSRPQ